VLSIELKSAGFRLSRRCVAADLAVRFDYDDDPGQRLVPSTLRQLPPLWTGAIIADALVRRVANCTSDTTISAR
jgi:hypothetical protein